MTNFPAQLTFELPSNCSIPDTQIFIAVLGKEPDVPVDSAKFGYLDFETSTFQANYTVNNFSLDTATMVRSLAQIKALDSDGRYIVQIPRIVSGRVYFAFKDNFDKMAGFSSSGPTNSKNNHVLYDKIELHTADNPNINATNVDFYGVSYKVTVTDTNTGQQRSVGFETPSQTIIAAFNAIASSPEDQENGNTDLFKQLMIKNEQGETVRVLAPKAAGLTDWGGATLTDQINNATKCSHFWDDYVNNSCWKPGRTFSCYSKLYNKTDPNSNHTIYYGKVSEDGQTLSLFTDAAMQKPYSVPSLPRPSNPWGVPNFSPPPPDKPSLYQNLDSNNGSIDWGFLLFANAGSDHGLGEYWNSDPVVIAIMVSICRGVMHYDDGCDKWTDSSYFYKGDGQGNSTADFPIFYFSKILHDYGVDNRAYVLSYDDVYGGEDPTIYFNGYPDITISFSNF